LKGGNEWMNLDQMLQIHAKSNPEKKAVGWEDFSLTYKELNDNVQKLANQFFLNGIEVGDRIAIILANCPEFIISYYACMRVGALSVTINPTLTSRELGIIMNDCEPKIVICNQVVNETLQNTNLNVEPQYLTVNHFSLNEILEHGPVENVIPRFKAEECSIIYTSGTTGIPKGAVLTYDNLYHNAKTFAESFGMTEKERTLIVAPLFHTAAQTNCLNATIYSGGFNYLLPRWISTTNTLQTMEDERITFFFGPPTMYTYILNEQNLDKYNLSLRIVYTGAAPLPEEIFNKWTETFGFEIVEGYGLTETSPVVSFNPPNGRKKLRSIGLPMKDVHVKIVNELLEEAQVNEPGELLVKGPNVMKGYWNRPEENRKVFVDGWFRTGDVAKKDEDGYLYIVDRKKDMIIRSGFNIYPREIEEVLYQHPAVLEAAVIGCPDAEKGELVKAVITLKQEVGEDFQKELETFCRKNLSGFKVPQQFEIVKEFPKTTTGKIMKTKLRDLYTEKSGK
jgi:long-chain acyl-CoA synthetase